MASSSPHRLLLLALLLLHATRATRLPHIVFFLADDYGFGDVGYHAAMYGNDTNRVRVQTPYAAALIPSYAAVNGSQTVRRASLSSLRYHGVTTALPRQTLHARVGTATHLTLLSPSLSFLLHTVLFPLRRSPPPPWTRCPPRGSAWKTTTSSRSAPRRAPR